MKTMMEITNMITNFVAHKASLFRTLSVLIAMPIRPRSKKVKKVGPLTGQPIIFKGSEAVPIHLDPKHVNRKSRSQNTTFSVIGLMGFLLSGCTGFTYSSHFDCPMGEGAGCASISRVNKMIDRQEIDLGNDDVPLSRGPGANQCQGLPSAHANQVYVYYGPDQLGRLISADEPTLSASQGEN